MLLPRRWQLRMPKATATRLRSASPAPPVLWRAQSWARSRHCPRATRLIISWRGDQSDADSFAAQVDDPCWRVVEELFDVSFSRRIIQCGKTGSDEPDQRRQAIK